MTATRTAGGHGWRGILAFLTIYVVWGSTFLAIRYAVETIPPLFVAATRHLIAGSLLLAWALWKGERPTRQGWRAGLILGVLFFLISHGLLHWAEQVVASGVAALVIATEPVFVALMLPLFKLGAAPKAKTYAGLALGIAGVLVLFRADVAVDRQSVIGLIAVLASSLAWAAGIVLSRRVQPATAGVMNAALPLVCGSLMLIVAGLLSGEHRQLDVGAVTTRVASRTALSDLLRVTAGIRSVFAAARALSTDVGRNAHVRESAGGGVTRMAARGREDVGLDRALGGVGDLGDRTGE